jgi:PTH1 family peptidyl-tRNA hydrolase
MVDILRWFGWAKRERVPSPVHYLFYGIGNPGVEYAQTRHNVGYRVVDRCLPSIEESRKMQGARVDVWIGRWAGSDSVVAVSKPYTYVNRSGGECSRLLRRYSLKPSSCIVVVDDINLPLGKLRLRSRGSAGGHNGLKSIIENIGIDFPRLRIGIGPVPQGVGRVEFVLGKFTHDEEPVIDTVCDEAVRVLHAVVHNGIERAMSVCN